MAKKCMQCGGATKKMAKGGSNTEMGIYGIPNAGRTDQLGFQKGGAIKKMAKGGSTKKQPCEYGEYWNGTKCVKNISNKVGAGVLAGGIGAMASYLIGTGDKSVARSKARDAKKAADKKIDTTAKKLSSTKVMKTGGMVKKTATTKRK